jgi:site-specific recombinase XerD
MTSWTQELADFLRFCELERRLAPMTCSAYERDVSACLKHLQRQGIRDLAEVRVTHPRFGMSLIPLSFTRHQLPPARRSDD